MPLNKETKPKTKLSNTDVAGQDSENGSSGQHGKYPDDDNDV